MTPNIVYELLVGGVLAATLVPVFVASIDERDDRSISAVFTVTMTALAIFTASTMLLSPLDRTRARSLAHENGRDPRRAAARPDVLILLLRAADGLLRLHDARERAAERAPPVRRRRLRAGREQRRRHRRAGRCSRCVRRTTRSAASTSPRIRNDLGLLLLLGIGTTAGIVAMALVLVPALRRASVRLRFVLRVARPGHPHDAAPVGMDGRLRRHQPARAAVRARAGERSAGDVSAYVYAFTFYVVPHGLLAVSIMTTMTPELARRRAAADDMPGLRRDFGLGLRYIVVLVLPASVLFACSRSRCSAMVRIGKFSGHDATVTADTLQVFAISSCRSRCTCTRCAASTRCRTPAPRSSSTLRERAQHRARARVCSRRSACRVSRWRGASPTSSPPASRWSCCAAGSAAFPTRGRRSGRREAVVGPARSRSSRSRSRPRSDARHRPSAGRNRRRGRRRRGRLPARSWP